METTSNVAYPCLVNLLKIVQKETIKNQIKIEPLSEKELSIKEIVNVLEEHFLFHYSTHGAAKLPVLAFYSLYHFIIDEIGRYNQCSLADLSSLTACDKTNKASGDIEIFKNESVFEAIEIKLDKEIDAHILRIVEQKIYKWNPQRYYILSVYEIKEEDYDDMHYIINNVKNNHGCQIIVNGIIATMKYYLRLVNNLVDFVNYYSHLIESDKEINIEHKQKWNELLKKLN